MNWLLFFINGSFHLLCLLLKQSRQMNLLKRYCEKGTTLTNCHARSKISSKTMESWQITHSLCKGKRLFLTIIKAKRGDSPPYIQMWIYEIPCSKGNLCMLLTSDQWKLISKGCHKKQPNHLVLTYIWECLMIRLG